VFGFNFGVFTYLTTKGVLNPSDYKIVFGTAGFGTSKDTVIAGKRFPATPVNFKIINLNENKEIEFVFSEKDSLDGRGGKLTIDTVTGKADGIYFLERDKTGKPRYTWQFTLYYKDGTIRNPQNGDTVFIVLNKPFLSFDTYRFKMKGMDASAEKAKANLDMIRVVPNPYVGAAKWEPHNTYSSGRGPREIHFINLPAACTIRIFNVSGAMVKKIDHVSSLINGTEIWNVLSDENFEIAYGIYVYHIDAPGIGQKTGTFAIIK
jgi:hypothetical protein